MAIFLLPTLKQRILAFSILSGLAAKSSAGSLASENQDVPPADDGPPLHYLTVVRAAHPSAQRSKHDDIASASVITRNRTPRSAETTRELLEELPGVSLTRSGGREAMATISLRGSTADQVAIYLDGIPLNSAVGGGVDLGLIPLGDMARLDVYRGMSPIAFGASAIGGVVSIESQRPDASGGKVALTAGSFGSYSAALQGTVVRGAWRMLARFKLFTTRGDFPFPSDNGTAFQDNDDAILRRKNNDLQHYDGSVRAYLDLPGKRLLSASLWLLVRTQGLPGNALYSAEFARLRTFRAIAALRYTSHEDLGAKSLLSVQLWFVNAEQRLDDQHNEIGLARQKTKDTTRRSGITLRAKKKLGRRIDLSLILEGRFARFTPTNALAKIISGPPSERVFLAAGVESLLHIDALRLKIQPSLRAEYALDRVTRLDLFGEFSGPTTPETYASPIVRLSASCQPAPWIIAKANIGRYARLPSLRERYGNTGFYLGNPDLDAESGFNTDIGVIFNAAFRRMRLRIEATLFHARVDDLIQLEYGSYFVRAQNRDHATIKGAELSFNTTLFQIIRITTQATFTDARDTSDIAARSGKYLPLRPRYRAYFKGEVRKIRLPWDLLGGGYTDLSLTGGAFLDPANLIAQPQRLLVGLGAYLDLPIVGMRAIASARNLLNNQIVDFGGFPLPGRSFFLTLEWSSADLDGATI